MATLRDSLTYEPAELAFGTSGLRALVTDMTDLECYINTLGFLRFVGETGTVYLAGDLRDSTPRILRAAAQAIADAGSSVEYLGLIPTPAIANYALRHGGAAIMVTGSHIPADRNGIKFYKPGGEILKEDEVAIKQAVAAVRAELYGGPAKRFAPDGAWVVQMSLSRSIPKTLSRLTPRISSKLPASIRTCLPLSRRTATVTGRL
jgi:phosphomannomutase